MREKLRFKELLNRETGECCETWMNSESGTIIIDDTYVDMDGIDVWLLDKVDEFSLISIKRMTFEQALPYIKGGSKARRSGWNGKGLYVQIENGGDYKFSEILPFFVIKNNKNSFNTWVPSVEDILANDWEIFN